MGPDDESDAPTTTTRSESSDACANEKFKNILVDDSRLMKLDARPNLFHYIQKIWGRRHFIAAESRSKTFSSGRDTYLGKLWVFLDPLFQVSVYAVIFGLILNISRGMDNFIGFLVIGVIFFGFISKGINGGSGLIQNSRGLISSFNFPRASVVLSATMRQMVDNILPALMAIALAVLFQLDKPIHWTIVLVIPLFVLIHVFNLGISLIVARLTAFVPDFKPIVSIVTRGLFFVSGVFFSIERFDTHPLLQQIVLANPVYQILQAARSCVMEGIIPSLDVWGYISAWSFGLLIVGFVYFWQAEERYTSVR